MADVIRMPKLGFDMKEGTLARWVKNVEDEVTKGEIIAEIETDKATVEVESGFSGVLRKVFVDQGTVVPINTPIALIGSKDEDITKVVINEFSEVLPNEKFSEELQPPVKGSYNPNETKKSTLTAKEPGRKKISPLARRLASERGIPLDSLEGSGPGGRIVRKDLDYKITQSKESQGIHLTQDKKVEPSKLRKIIRQRMVEAKQTIPHFYITRVFNVERLLDLRSQINSVVPESEKLSINDFIVKATALALQEFPNLNSALENETVVQFSEINIGVAVAVEGGLMTVVCKRADKKPLSEISQEIKQLVTRARSGKVHSEDIEGSTFSISNLGMYDVYEFLAIINPPEAAILAIGAAMEEPIVEKGEVKTGWRMRATISVDHRISDGEEAARFMQSLSQYIEKPVRLLIE